VVGLGGMAGAVGRMLIAKVVSYLLESTGNYAIPFVIAGSAYTWHWRSFRFWPPS
jgi:hypothetical protein